MLIILAIIGLIGLASGILMLASPSTWQKFNEKANAVMFTADKALTGLHPVLGIILVLMSLYILWSAYTILKLTF
jgi:hypothetical protein